MKRQTALPAWLIVLLILAGVAMTVVVALLLAQLDALQRRSQLPREPLQIIDQEATFAAGQLTVVVLRAEEQPGTPAAGATSGTTAVATINLPLTTLVPTDAASLTSTPVPTCSALPQDWVPYVAQKGDTLASLSYRYGISIDMLVQANCFAHEPLLPGQLIVVPLIRPTQVTRIACGVPAHWVEYTMKSEDTLFKLAQQRNTTVLLIMQANCLDSNYAAPGRKLLLPPIPDTSAEPDSRGLPYTITPER